jgi:hypothetical protein
VQGRDLAATLNVAALPNDYFALARRNRPAQDSVPVTVFMDRQDGEAFEAAKTLAGLGV